MSNAYQHISVSMDKHVLILSIDLKSIAEYELARALEKELVDAANTGESNNVVIDMGNLEFMSSVAYMPFISLRGCVREAGGRVIMCNLSDIVKQIFESTRLLINPQSPKSLFEYADTLEGAVAMFVEED